MENRFAADKLKSVCGYYLKVMPEVKKCLTGTEALIPAALRDPKAKRDKIHAVCRMNDLRCSGVLISQNDKAVSDYVEFAVSLHALCNSLDNMLEARELTDISQIQQLYLPLSDSMDPDMPPVFNSGFYSDMEITAYLKKLSDRCRQKISALPKYKRITGKMRKYAKLYIEYQSCRYQPLKTRRENLRMWSEYYIRQFPEISFWEFAASADSLLGICAMYVSAMNPELTEETVNRMESTYMPWICAYHKILHYYVSAREDTMTGRMNLTDFYQNLRQCEERIRFLAGKSLESCMHLPDSSIHKALVQALPVIYLSDPRACFGLNRLASRNIIKDSPVLVRSMWNLNRFLNAFR